MNNKWENAMKIKRRRRTNWYLERTVRIKKGFLEITEMKRERDGPSAIKAYPIPAAIVISLSHFSPRKYCFSVGVCESYTELKK